MKTILITLFFVALTPFQALAWDDSAERERQALQLLREQNELIEQRNEIERKREEREFWDKVEEDNRWSARERAREQREYTDSIRQLADSYETD